MKALTTSIVMLLVLGTMAAFAQQSESTKIKTSNTMNTYVIERQIPNAGALTPEDLKGISQMSCGVLKELGPDIQWIESYVTQDKVFCIYKATNEDILREHAEKGGFPINAINLLSTIISPATAELTAQN